MSAATEQLKHKMAYVAIGEFKPGMFSKAQELYEKAVSTYKEGFKGSFLLNKTGTDEGIAIIMWNDASDMADNESEIYRELLEQMNKLFVKPPVTDFYEICSEIGGYC